MRGPPQRKKRDAILREVTATVKLSDLEEKKKRESVQRLFWNQVGAVEHVNVPKLEDAIRKQFGTQDKRLIQKQVNLMQSEGRIIVQNKFKVWVNQPESGN
jgi:hypothetical protein